MRTALIENIDYAEDELYFKRNGDGNGDGFGNRYYNGDGSGRLLRHPIMYIIATGNGHTDIRCEKLY